MECGACGTLALLDVPPGLSRFYPTQELLLVSGWRSCSRSSARRHGQACAVRSAAPHAGATRAQTARCAPGAGLLWLSGLRLSTRSSVCDVGSGDGQCLLDMQRQGFQYLSGFDPYLESNVTVGGSIELHKQHIDSVEGRWDVIMLNHVFEHMAEPRRVLELLREQLTQQGAVLIRTPVADSWAWKHYGTNWVQLDPPGTFTSTRPGQSRRWPGRPAFGSSGRSTIPRRSSSGAASSTPAISPYEAQTLIPSHSAHRPSPARSSASTSIALANSTATATATVPGF
jgi:hypothetical protein